MHQQQLQLQQQLRNGKKKTKQIWNDQALKFNLTEKLKSWPLFLWYDGLIRSIIEKCKAHTDTDSSRTLARVARAWRGN